MPSTRVGLWLVGAKGGVATTLLTGLAGLRTGAVEPVGLVTSRPPFHRLGLVEFSEIVVGGHDIRPGRLGDEARRMWEESRAIDPALLAAAEPLFAAVERRQRPGTVVATGERIREFADPAVAALVERGVDVCGPLPADTLFLRASQGLFDGVVAMYHDQGHIPVKLLGMHRAVNITLGLPIVRTSVAHGTAFDIVGTATADATSMLSAIDAATRLVAAGWPAAATAAAARAAAHSRR